MSYASLNGVPKTNELLQTLIRISVSPQVDALALRRIIREAEHLKRVDRGGAYMCLGVVAALQGDLEGVRRNHEAAVACATDKTIALANYAISLQRLYRFRDAVAVVDEASKLNPGDPGLVDLTLKLSVQGGLFREAAALLEQWKRQHSGQSHELDPPLRMAVSMMDDGSLEQGAVEAVILHACQVLLEQKLPPTPRWNLEGGVEDGARSLNYWLREWTDGEGAAKLNEELADAISVDPAIDDNTRRSFTVIFLPQANQDGSQLPGLSQIG